MHGGRVRAWPIIPAWRVKSDHHRAVMGDRPWGRLARGREGLSSNYVEEAMGEGIWREVAGDCLAARCTAERSDFCP